MAKALVVLLSACSTLCSNSQNIYINLLLHFCITQKPYHYLKKIIFPYVAQSTGTTFHTQRFGILNGTISITYAEQYCTRL
jgi:hypothetical protein